MVDLFVVPIREQRTFFLDGTCSLDNFTDQQVANRYRLDRGSILYIATPKVSINNAMKQPKVIATPSL